MGTVGSVQNLSDRRWEPGIQEDLFQIIDEVGAAETLDAFQLVEPRILKEHVLS